MSFCLSTLLEALSSPRQMVKMTSLARNFNHERDLSVSERRVEWCAQMDHVELTLFVYMASLNHQTLPYLPAELSRRVY